MRVNARDHAHMNRMRLITLFAREKEKERTPSFYLYMSVQGR